MKVEITNPYVGLRPFNVEESILFFGRNEQTLELLQRLHQHHFVAVVGSSGCGKSSLLLAGLIPALKAGYLVNDSDRWFISIMKPGQNPLFNLAEAILIQIQPQPVTNTINNLVLQIKEDGADAILKLIAPIRKEKNINFFLLVDQFEELFRFASEQNDVVKNDECVDFVKIILELAQQSMIPFYVVITMRSDFIGDCAQFFGLPEAMNKSLYLVPRLNRLQLQTVIEGPAKLYGGKLEPSLTSRLLNDLVRVKDELPLLQHSLMRMWEFEMIKNKSGTIDLEDYQSIGGIEKALSIHADEALAGMSDSDLKITKVLFQALTAIDENGRKIRRPILLSQLKVLTNGMEAHLMHIIDLFIKDRRTFLIINKTGDTGENVIDISHESLIRQWNTLSTWVDEEWENAAVYLQLAEALRLKKLNKRDYLEGTELQIMLDWKKKFNPSSIWANRYKVGFDEAINYLQQSEKLNNEREAELFEREQQENDRLKHEEERARNENKRKIKLRLLSIAIFVLLIFTYFTILFLAKSRKSESIALIAIADAQIATQKTGELLKLVLQGRGKEYENLTDSSIIKRLQIEQNYPLDSLIVPRASVSGFNDNSTNRNYLIWIDVPSFRRDEIKEVRYTLCKGFADRLRISNEPSSSFSIGYLGWGYCPLVLIDIILVKGDTIKRNFSFDNYFKNHALIK